MEGRVENKSETARHVILKSHDELYYVSTVTVRFRHGREKCQATFHAQRADDGRSCDLDFEIPQKLYGILAEYTRLGDPDLILILAVDNNEFRWSLVSERLLRQYSDCRGPRQYIV